MERVEVGGPAARAGWFNRACYAVAGAGLLAALLLSFRRNPVGDLHDFSQFYMGGVMARLGAWDSLYPVPRPGSLDNAGEKADSTMRPRYALEAEARGVGDKQRFIQPPPFALMLAPLGFLPYARAMLGWKLLMIACAWGAAVQAGKLYQSLHGRPTRGAGAVALLAAASPLLFDSVRILNMSPLMALLLGAAALDLVRGAAPVGASSAPGGPEKGRRLGRLLGPAAVVAGAVSKYAAAVLVPLYLIQKRWRALVAMVVLSAALLGACLLSAGAGPFEVFFKVISPTLARPHTLPWNQSAYAVASRAAGRAPLPAAPAMAVRAAQAAVLAIILGLCFLRRPGRRAGGTTGSRPAPAPAGAAHVAAAAAALVAWLLIFQPTSWDHTFVYLCPFWGYLAWEARRSWPRAAAAAVAVAWQALPPALPESFLARFHLRGPYDSSMLLSAVIVLVLAVARLASPGAAAAVAPPE